MIDTLTEIGSAILWPLYWITSVILSGFHSLFSTFLPEDSGAAWALSIIGLTLVVRAALIPLFVKQIKSSRNMQLLQPRVRELQKKYAHDREKLGQETMALYRETGTNPFASCLPILLQMPIFLALFRLIDNAAHGVTRGVLTQDQVESLSNATIFGAHIADTFMNASGESATQVRILAAILVIAMTATTFLTQRQLMSKNMPADAMQGPYAQQQKMLLYILPVVFAVGGIAFPIGVLIYWTTSNLWTMGQQFYVIRNNPAPGTPAARAKEARDAAKRHAKGVAEPPRSPGPAQDPGKGSGQASATGATAPPPPSQPRRQQPKKQSREQRKKGRPKGQRPPGGRPKSGPAGPD